MPLPGTQPLPAGIALRPLRDTDTPPLVAAAVTEGDAPSHILLRETPEALVYAGALADAGGRVLQWLEIWVQRLTGSPFFHLGNTAPSGQERDARWNDLQKSFTDSGD